MFEALNAIDRRYESYLGMAAAPRPAPRRTPPPRPPPIRCCSPIIPGQKAGLDDSYNVAMLAVADAAARDKGKAIGEAAAKLALAAGGFDPARKPVHYRPRTCAGMWTATQLPVYAALYLHLQAVDPAELRRRSGRPPPPALTSERWARDFDEIKRLGAQDRKRAGRPSRR